MILLTVMMAQSLNLNKYMQQCGYKQCEDCGTWKKVFASGKPYCRVCTEDFIEELKRAFARHLPKLKGADNEDYSST